MTLAKDDRLENQKAAFSLMMEALSDRAIDTSLFDPTQPPFDGQIVRTTWEELARQGHVEKVGAFQYRLTAKGWRVGLDLTSALRSAEYPQRVGRVLAAMKRHVKGRKDSAIVPLRQLATESGEAEGWIFNLIDSRSSGSRSQKTGATWYESARGRLVEIPADFNLEPGDIVSALTLQHRERVELLEGRLEEAEDERRQLHCPFCDAPVSSIGHQDYPELHCIVTYVSFACGYSTADGFEEAPCPYGPHWPNLDEFELITKRDGKLYVCHAIGKTERARRVHMYPEMGKTREEAEERARRAVAPKRKQASPNS